MATLFGSIGDDSFSGTPGNDVLQGGPAPDPTVDTGDDTLFGGAGADVILGYGGDDSLNGQDGDDRVVGGVGDDWLSGFQGRDTVLGGSGNDTLFSGSGDFVPDNADTMDGGLGDDVVWIAWDEAQPGESLAGGAGFDILQLGRATLSQTAVVNGFEKLEIGAYASVSAAQLLGITSITPFETGSWGDWTRTPTFILNATTTGVYDFTDVTILGMERFNATVGADTVIGSGRADTIWGANGGDWLDGGTGADSLNGGSGDDQLVGGAGDDVLVGAIGADRLRGGDGLDRLVGGQGADTFQFFQPDRGLDTIQDFVSGLDRIRIDAEGFNLAPGEVVRFRGFTDVNDPVGADPTFSYNARSGALAFDADGGDPANAVVFAILTGAPTLASADLRIL